MSFIRGIYTQNPQDIFLKHKQPFFQEDKSKNFP